nr:MAG TPA: minor tail protein [Caudoviricetes sp.]
MSGGTPLGNMVIKLGLDDAEFGKGVANSKKQVKYLAKEMQANMKIADLAGNQLGKLGTRYDGLTKIIGTQENQVKALKKAYDESFVDGKATDSTKRLAAELQDANGKLANYKQQLINTSGAIAEYKVRNEGFTGAINKTSDSLIKNGQIMESYGGKLTKGVTVPLVAGAAAVTTAAISWESSFAGVKKTVDEVVDSNGRVTYSYKDLENGLRGLAKELPSSHKEIAAVAEAAGQLGIETPNVVGFTKTMIDLGESTSMSAETAATELSRFANITGMSQDKFSNLGSALVDLGNNFTTTEGEISAMSLRLAGAGSQIGMTEGEILGFAAALSSVGVEAEAGGSAFSKVMIQMQLATEKGGDSLTNFAQVAGTTNEEFQNMFKNDPSQAIMKFVEGLSKAEEQGTSAIKVLDDMGITEVRLRDSLLRAANASGTFSSAVEMGNKAFSENTALAEEAGKRYETTESKLKKLKNEAVDAAIDLGGPFVDALRSGLEASKPLIKGLGDLAKKFSEMDPKTQQTIIGFVGAAAAAGPLLSVTGKLTSKVGGLGKAFVDLSAKSAKKKAIAEITGELAKGTLSVDTLSTSLVAGATKFGTFGSAASSASGASGVGAMISSITTLNPFVLGLVGAGGALALGYGAWKLWGEEAWNSAQRTKQWGSDVGSATDEALTKFKGYSEGAIGEMSLVEQGISGNTESIVGNFAEMGQSIETEMTGRIATLKEMVKTIPEDVRAAAEELTNDEISSQEKRLSVVKENNEKISQIRQEASNNNRQISYEETVRIKALAEESAEAYVLSLGKSEADTKQILGAMTGNVESASKDQASAWLQSLGKQRQDSKVQYSQMRKDMESELVDAGYDLNSSYAKEMLGLLETSGKAATELTEDQMAVILGKYPELADEVFLANGQLIDSMGDAGKQAVLQNKEMMDSFANLSRQAAENAEKNKDKLKLVLDEADSFGEFWNKLVLDPKTGEVKTNAQEEVNKAAESEAGWNQLMWLGKQADVSSNVKMMIAEAAIANGKWDSLSFTEQQALLDSNVAQTMTQALQAKGSWEHLTFEQKKAIIYSNTPEVMAETMLNLGLWKDYQPEIKELKAENFDFLTILSQSEEKLDNWNNTPDSIKKFQGENYDLLNKIYSSDENFNRWKNIPDDTKSMFAENSDLLEKLATSDAMLEMWNNKSPEEKKLLANNSELMEKILSSSETLNAWNGLPPQIKNFIGNNENLLQKIEEGQLSQDLFDKNLPAIKLLLGDASSVIKESTTGEKFLNFYKSNNPSQKILTGDSRSVKNASITGGSAIDTFNGKYPLPKTMIGIDSASGPANAAKNAVDAFNWLPNVITKTLKVVKNITGLEDGTNFHKGGPAVVNDQKGPLYKELVQYPTGETFIPEGRNVLLDLPRGSKVFKASRTKSIMNRMGVPRYAEGVGVPKNSSLVKNLESVGYQNNAPQQINLANDESLTVSRLDDLINIMSQFGDDLKNFKLVMNDKEVAHAIGQRTDLTNKIKARRG